MNNRLRDSTKQLMNHDRLVVLGDRVEGLLNNVAAEWVHRQVQCVAADGLCNLDYLFGCSVFKAALNQEVPETIDHERIGLRNNSLNDLVLLLGGSHLELLLKKDGGLLVVVTDD